MSVFLFYLFAAITLGFGLMVVLAKNPVTSALSLAMSFVGLAALFITLDAYFLGILQILVYAGAVMVLFLFIIMLLDIKREESKKRNHVATVGAIAVGVLLMLQVVGVLSQFSQSKQGLRETGLNPAAAAERADLAVIATVQNDLKIGQLPDAKLMGVTLFDRYGFHLQVVGLILLVSTVGVVVLSKRDRTETPSTTSETAAQPPQS